MGPTRASHAGGAGGAAPPALNASSLIHSEGTFTLSGCEIAGFVTTPIVLWGGTATVELTPAPTFAANVTMVFDYSDEAEVAVQVL